MLSCPLFSLAGDSLTNVSKSFVVSEEFCLLLSLVRHINT